MGSYYKICIYLKGREKPVILTDMATKEHPYEETVKYFQDVMKGENKISVLDFTNDHTIFNHKDIDTVKISKPELKDNDILTLDDDESNTITAMDDEAIMIKSDEEMPEFDSDEKVTEVDEEEPVLEDNEDEDDEPKIVKD